MSEIQMAKLVVEGVEKAIATGVSKVGGQKAAETTVAAAGAAGVADAVKVSATPTRTGSVPGLLDLVTKPFEMGARVIDRVTGHTRVHIDTHTTVMGTSPAKWVEQFIQDPSKISPLASGAHPQGKAMVGRPFPLGPEIGIEIKARQDVKTAEGLARTILEVEYSGAFQGPGRITVTQKGNGMLDVRDEWHGLANHSLLPTLAAENGHPLVAGLGFKGMGARADGRQPNLFADVAETAAVTSFKVMTAPFSLFRKLLP